MAIRTAKKQLHLSGLHKGMPGLVPHHARSLTSAAAVCLETIPHAQGVRFAKVGLMTEDLRLRWTRSSDQAKSTYADLAEATEWGATAVAILFTKELTGKVVIQRAPKGTGFDYWLGDSAGTVPFQGLARLEVSGILRGTRAQVATRVARKKTQLTPTDDVAPGLVAVVEFGTPTAHIESK